jgi:hypothetical protein
MGDNYVSRTRIVDYLYVIFRRLNGENEEKHERM